MTVTLSKPTLTRYVKAQYQNEAKCSYNLVIYASRKVAIPKTPIAFDNLFRAYLHLVKSSWCARVAKSNINLLRVTEAGVHEDVKLFRLMFSTNVTLGFFNKFIIYLTCSFSLI